jgi:hypothetical protein
MPCAAELSYGLGIYGQPRPASAIHFRRFRQPHFIPFVQLAFNAPNNPLPINGLPLTSG